MSDDIEDTNTEEVKPKSTREKYAYWSTEIKAAKKRLEKWHKQGQQINKRYLAQHGNTGTAELDGSGAKTFKLNVFYSNISTLESMLYGSIPKVDVSRRYADAKDDVGRVASEILERMLNSDLASNGKEIDTTLKSCLQDRLLSGLGCARVRYEFKEGTREVPAPTVDDPLAMVEEQYMVDETAPVDYYFWGDVLWGWSRNFAELPWMAFRNFLTKEEVKERFSEEIAQELNYTVRTVSVTDDDDENKDLDSDTKKAEVWEIWDKKERKVCFFNDEFKQLLDSQEDPLGLSGFFPAPPFLLANPTTTLYIPTPDYKLAEDLYNQIEILQTRIAVLTEAVKAVGVYDGGAEGVQRMMTEGTDNKLIPVEKWAQLSEKGGLARTIEWMPIADIVNALDKLTGQRNDAISLLQQITGMADVMRGQLDNQYEGVGQTEQKAKFGSVRVQALQEQFAVFATDLMQIKAEVIARHFSPETIQQRSNMEHSFDVDKLPAAIALIKQPEKAKLSVKIESESMAMVDYAELRAERTAFMNGVSQFMQAVTPIIEQRPESEPFMLQLLQWGLSGFKGAQQIEGLLDRTIEASEEANAAKEGEPSPEEKAEQQRQQVEQAKTQAALQAIEAKAQADMQIREHDKQADMETAQHQHQLDMERIQAEGQKVLLEIQAKSQAEQMKQIGDAEANVAQTAATTQQEIEKSAIQSSLKINEMVTKASTDLKVMKAKNSSDAADKGED